MNLGIVKPMAHTYKPSLSPVHRHCVRLLQWSTTSLKEHTVTYNLGYSHYVLVPRCKKTPNHSAVNWNRIKFAITCTSVNKSLTWSCVRNNSCITKNDCLLCWYACFCCFCVGFRVNKQTCPNCSIKKTLILQLYGI